MVVRAGDVDTVEEAARQVGVSSGEHGGDARRVVEAVGEGGGGEDCAVEGFRGTRRVEGG